MPPATQMVLRKPQRANQRRHTQVPTMYDEVEQNKIKPYSKLLRPITWMNTNEDEAK